MEDWIKEFFRNFLWGYRPPIKSGAIPDTRTPEEKAKDVKHEDIVAGTPPFPFITVPQENWRQYPIFNQDGSYSCGANMLAKMLGIKAKLKYGKFVNFSRKDIYDRRANYPATGMTIADLAQIGLQGVCLEALRPSDGLAEAQMNDKTDENAFTDLTRQDTSGLNALVKTPVYIQPDINAIASVIAPLGNPVGLLVSFTDDEWQGLVPVRKPANDKSPETKFHFVTGIQATLFGNVPSILINDSWGAVGINGTRVLTRDWFDSKRVIEGLYYI